MVFEAFRVTPEIKLDSFQTKPGSTVEGTLYVTSTSAQPVEVKEIWISFEGRCSIKPSTQHSTDVEHDRSAKKASPEKNDARTDSAQVTGSASKKWITDFNIQFGPLELGCSEDGNRSKEDTSGDVSDDSVPQQSTRSPDQQPSSSVKITVAQESMPLRLTTTEFTQGVHALRFSIKVPLDYEGQPLPPTFDLPDQQASIQYKVGGTLKFSPLIKRNAQSYVHMSTGDIPGYDVPDWDRVVELQRTVPVGTWLRDSTQLWQLVKYYLGGDTAARWSEMTLHATQRNLKKRLGLPVYLQDSLGLSIRLVNGIPPVALYVDRVQVGLYTTILVSGERVARANHDFEILDARDINFPVSFSAEKQTADITAVLSGARIPSTVPPTVTLPNIQIQHWLKLSVGLRAGSPDGTRQAVAQTELKSIIGLIAA